MVKILNPCNAGKDEYTTRLEDSLEWFGTKLKDGKRFAQYTQMKDCWESSAFKIIDNIQLPDYFVSGGMSIVSRNLMNFVNSYQEDEIEYLPIQILEVSGKTNQDYFFMNVFKKIDCIDFEKSDCDWNTTKSGATYLGLIHKFILKPVDLSGVSIFCPADYTQLFVTESFADALLASGYTGFFFGTLLDPYGYETYWA